MMCILDSSRPAPPASPSNAAPRRARALSRLAAASAPLFTLGLIAVGCAMDVPLEESADATSADEAIGEGAEDLAKGCPSGQTFCANEFDPDLGQYTICCASNEVCSDGACIPTRPLEHGTAYIKYKVLSLIYSPPGKMSSVSYASASTLGTRVETESSFGSGVVFQLQSSAIDISSEFKTTAVQGTSFEQKKTTTTTYTRAASAARPDDELTPGDDAFYVWLNPKIDVNEVAPKSYTATLGATNNAINAVWITVSQIENPSLRPSALTQKLQAANITEADLANIRALDPFATGATPTAQRFPKVTTLQLIGPVQPGGDVPSVSFAIDNEAVKGSITSLSITNSVQILAGFELNFFVTTSLKVGGKWDWAYDTQSAITNGESQSANAMLKTETVQYYADYDILYDAVFRTFAFQKQQPPAGAVAVTGTLTDERGAPVAYQRVRVLQSDGSIRDVATDGEGRYQLRNVPPGELEIVAGDVSRALTVPPSGAATLDLVIPLAQRD